jgi:hypothetical protein
MTFMIWGVSTVMTVNVKVAQATQKLPSPLREKGGEEGNGHDFHDLGCLHVS